MKQSRLPRSLISLQDKLASLLGSEPSSREGVVAGMLHSNPSEATGYWLQLLVAAGIATLGLVLGSTAVVIGAMLIAPLMTPIVNFGMGLAVGSPFLVIRAGGRIVLSVLVVVGSSAGLVAALPFHELNAEIAARTTPTALDLLTAAFCAVAGVYAAMRPPSDVATTAAGTSIGISLVPPLCASGFGIGTASWSVASGAALLFLTNLAAIVVVGTIAFVAAGFNQVDVEPLEREELGVGTDAPLARQLARMFSSRGAWLRFLMPFLLLAAVYVPLRKALDEVAWQIRVRGSVQSALAQLPTRIVHSKVFVERGEVDIALVILGSTADADSSRTWLRQQLKATANVTPRLEVFAVPDAAGVEAALLRAPTPVVPSPKPEVVLKEARASIHDAVAHRWPNKSAGRPLLITMAAQPGSELRVSVFHLGPALEPSGREALEKAFSEDLGEQVVLTDGPIPAETLAPGGDEASFLASVATVLEATRHLRQVAVCVTFPAVTQEARPSSRPASQLSNAVKKMIQGHPGVSTFEGESLELRVVDGPCVPPAVTVETPAP